MIKQLGRFSRTYRSLFRYREIVGVLIKFGFGDLVQVLGLDKYLELSAQFFSGKAGNRQPYSRWDRVRMVFEELGPTFEKLGQVLSTRPDFVPEGLIVQLEKLQSSIPPFPADEARCVLETSLGKPITEVFRSFSDECIASASIAQVHQAVLPNGEVLALKIQRPGIAKVIDLDLQILNHIATLMEKHIPEMRPFNLVAVVEEFGKTIRKELDFNQEANNLYRFDNNFKGHKDIYVPKLYRQYSSTKVLAMEFVQGIMLSDTAQVLASGMDMERMATKGANLVLIQIFDHGFFHADPHPGNLMLMHDGRFCFLDFGMMGNLIPKYRRLLGDFIIGFANQDERKLARVLLEFSENDTPVNVDLLETRVAELVDQFSNLPLKDINFKEVLDKAIALVMDFDLKMPASLYLLSKAIATIEGIGLKLYPEFDMMALVRPFAKRIFKQRFGMRNLAKSMYAAVDEMRHMLLELPFESREIMAQIKEGRVSIRFHHTGLEPFIDRLERSTNRISFAIVLASLIIGSSLIVMAKIPPYWQGVPLIGAIGYLIAGVLALGMLFSILRKGKF